jgi:hypothetical protein
MDADEQETTGELSGYEVVMLFGADEEIDSEMFFAEFETLISGAATLNAYAGSLMKAAFCVVGNGLALTRIAFFTFKVDESGMLDPAFNIPLRYLVQSAGSGADLGQGPIRKASRGQCPVPWHAINLWEPIHAETVGRVQRRIYRNKLKLNSSTGLGTEAPQDNVVSSDVELYQTLQTFGSAGAPNQESIALDAKLTDVFGEAGKLSLQDVIRLHTQQLEEAQIRHRSDLAAHQMIYLDQIRSCKEEIHQLKVTLRQQQSHNQRLQQMLRGDI